MDGINTLASGNIDWIRYQYALLPSNEVYEQNESTISELYLEARSNQSFNFSTSQINTIRTIACQCPLAGGNAVYLARGLYAITNDTTYDDQELCLQAGINYKRGDKIQDVNNGIQFKVYPNPANTTVTISWEFTSDEIARYSIVNSLGQQLLTNFFKLADKSITFDTSNILPGVYELNISIPGKSDDKMKLIIVH